MPSKIKSTVRLPDHIHKWLEDRAERNIRSANSELITILQTAMAADKAAEHAPLREAL